MAEALVLRYGERTAVAESDFTVPAGRVTAVIGPNGSGKSTLLHAVVGLVRPASGRLKVLGRSPAEARRDVAYVFQSVHVNELIPVTVREVVAMGRYARRGAFGILDRDDRRAVARALERLDVADLASRHLRELSGGQRQRVFVAQGLAQEAALLLLDEPLTALDVVSHELIDRAVEDERRAGRTVVVTTHDIPEASRADHVLLLAGRVVASGPPVDVLTRERLAAAYGGHLAHLDDQPFGVDDTAHRPGH